MSLNDWDVLLATCARINPGLTSKNQLRGKSRVSKPCSASTSSPLSSSASASSAAAASTGGSWGPPAASLHQKLRHPSVKKQELPTAPSTLPSSSSYSGRAVVTIASDCSGLGSDLLALKKFHRHSHIRHLFASDSSKQCRQVLRQTSPKPEQIFHDCSSKKRRCMTGSVTIYSAGPPCQPFSTEGQHGGDSDSRNMLQAVATNISLLMPKSFIIENVKGLLSKRHRATWQDLIRRLKNIGDGEGRQAYQVRWRVINAQDYGTPQNRPRVYVVGILGSASAGQSAFAWPKKRPRTSMKQFLSQVAAARKSATPLQATSATTRPLSKTNQRNLTAGLRKLQDLGAGPSTDAIIDIGHGRTGHVSLMIDRCPTVTRTRAAGQDYWLTSQQRRLSPDEIAALQGIWPKEGDQLFQGTSMRQRLLMLGNAMPVNVMEALMQATLRALGVQ